MAIKDTGERFKAHYDKLIAVVVMLALLGSLVYLAVQIGVMKKRQAAYKAEIERKTPAHPNAEAMSPEPYEKALGEIRRPHTMQVSTNSQLFVPEKRYYCFDFHCLRPVEFSVTNACTWCGKAPQEVKVKFVSDIDEDGMPNDWEKENKLDQYDPSDADQDPDGDKFTNLQEFEGGTDPHDGTDFPPLIVLVEVVETRSVQFRMLFQGKVKMGDGKLKFQMNYAGRTYFVVLGQQIGDSGFKLGAYCEKSVMVFRESLGKEVKRDVSEVDLVRERDNKTVTLVFQQPRVRVEPRATLRLELDDLTFEDLEVGDTIELRDGTYEVKAIDSEEDTVVLTRKGETKRFTVTKGGSKPADDDEEQ